MVATMDVSKDPNPTAMYILKVSLDNQTIAACTYPENKIKREDPLRLRSYNSVSC